MGIRLFLLLFCVCVFAQKKKQKDPPQITVDELMNGEILDKDLKSLYSVQKYNPLSPAKAAFYSAVVPGLGQIYNKRYWKLPIVYGALGTATYFFAQNRNQYLRVREAYRLREYGLQDEFTQDDGEQRLSDQALIHAQERLKRQMDESMFILIGLYLLQVLEASVDAHLLQVKAQKDWAVRPRIQPDLITKDWNFSLGVHYRF